jgi:hypothetical protein
MWLPGCESIFNFLLVVRYLFFINVAFFIDSGQLQRIAGYDLKVGPALIALNDFPFIDIFGIDVQRVVAFRTYD